MKAYKAIETMKNDHLFKNSNELIIFYLKEFRDETHTH